MCGRADPCQVCFSHMWHTCIFFLFLTGGADGTVRVWSRGSVAGGGPSPTVETAYETYAREITQNVY